METLVPYMKRSGGYIFVTDHFVSDSAGLEEFRTVMERLRELGRC